MDRLSLGQAEQKQGKASSRWVVIARTEEAALPFMDRSWLPLHGQFGGELWTDDFTDLLSIMHWH